jgi:hypothetical protein
MAYLDDEALARELNRQRLLSGQAPIGFGADALGVLQPMVQGLKLPQGQPGGPVPGRDTPAPLQVAPGGMRSGTVTPEQWRDDQGLAQALGQLGNSGGIRDFLARLQAARGAPVGKVERGADLAPPAGTSAAASGAPLARPMPPAPSAQQLIPGLQQPIDPRDTGYPAAAPAAQSYMHERDAGVPPVRGVEKPPPQAAPAPRAPPAQAGPGSSQILADQRKDIAAYFDANPDKKDVMAAIALSESGDDRLDRTGVAEAGANRIISLNRPVESIMDRNYYQPMHDGRGKFDKALRRVKNDPALRAEIHADLDRAFRGGSNTTNLATDFATSTVADDAAQTSTETHQSRNGQRYFRKDIDHPDHGNIPKRTRDWHNNTAAALVDEKPAASTKTASADSAAPVQELAAPPPQDLPAGEGIPGKPPGWLTDAVGNYAAEKGVAPGTSLGTMDPNAPAPAPVAEAPIAPPSPGNLTREALQAKGRELLAKRAPIEPATLDPGSQPAVQNPDGSISTVRTIGANVDGKEVNLPTVSPEGKILTNDQAVQQYRDTGKHLGVYDNPITAEAAAKALHNQEASQIGQVPKDPAARGLAPAQNADPVGYAQAGADAQRRLLSPTPDRWQAQAPATAMTPEIGKAVMGAIKAEGADAPTTPAQVRVPEAQPVLPAEPPPPMPGATPGQPGVTGTSLGTAPGMMPQMFQPQNQLSLMPFAPPPPVAPVDMSTPLTQPQAIGTLWEPPIPWDMMSDWGWGGTGFGSGGGGFDFGGGGGGFDFGGGSGFTGWGSTFGG